ncbi:MAG: hemerythrin domain-containing protein [Candidatus Kapaibacteriales bacterium]
MEKEHKTWLNIKTLLKILWEYGELCHNMKEAKVFFPLLLNNGFPQQGPISVMLGEHEAERQYLAKILNLFSKDEKNDNDIQELTRTIMQYSNLTKDHIRKKMTFFIQWEKVYQK